MKISTFVYLDKDTTEENIKEIEENVRRIQILADFNADIFIAKDINPQVEGKKGAYPYFQNRQFHEGYCLQVCPIWKNCTIRYANRFTENHPSIVEYCPFGLQILTAGIQIEGKYKGIIASEAFLSHTPTPKQLLEEDAKLKKEIVPFLPSHSLDQLKNFYDILGNQLKNTLSIAYLTNQLKQSKDVHQLKEMQTHINFNKLDISTTTQLGGEVRTENLTSDGSILSNASEVIQKVIIYIHQNYLKKITLEDVALEVHLNAQYLSRLFKKEINQSFVDYLNGLRVKRACELLKQTNYTIYRIAIETGFSDAPYFTRVFVKHMNMTPGNFRKSKLIL